MRRLRFKLSILLLVLLLLSGIHTKGQEMLGVAFSVYNGVSSASLNPAFLTGTKVYMDVNAMSGDFSLANDMVYFPSENNTLIKSMHGDSSVYRNGMYKWGRAFNYYDNKHNKYFASNVKIQGPSIMMQVDKHAFGITTAFRSFQSGNKIPYQIPITLYEGIEYQKLQGVEFDDDPYSFASMAWSEIGLSYAYNIYDRYSNRLTLGVSAKALFGHQGAYVSVKNSNYIVEDMYTKGKTVDFKNLDMEAGFALPVSYGTEFEMDLRPVAKGYGMGVDIGLVYTKLKSKIVYERKGKICEKPYVEYKYKIGISLLDLGGIMFSHDTQLHKFTNVSKYWEHFDTIRFSGINYGVRNYSNGFYGDPDASYAGSKMRIMLPATISLQFDYHLTRRVYLAGLWMHPIKFSPNTLWRPSQIAFVPRYESRLVGVSLPISLFNYQEPRVGLAVRLYSFTIGTERLGSLLGISNFNGTNIYFSIRFNLCKGACSTYKTGACQSNGFGERW